MPSKFKSGCACACIFMMIICIAASSSLSSGEDSPPFLSVKTEGGKVSVTGPALSAEGYNPENVSYCYYHDKECSRPVKNMHHAKPGCYWVTATVTGLASGDFTSEPAEFVSDGTQFMYTGEDDCWKIIIAMSVLSAAILAMSFIRRSGPGI